jgi:hypothetical protein
MPFELVAWMVLGLLAVVVCHELTHVLIARLHGHETVCVAVNPVGVAVVFEDNPTPRYWALQVILPMIVTAIMSYIWLFALITYPSEMQPVFATRGVLESLPGIVALMAVLTSGGDIFGFVMESRRPVWGEERVRRDLRLLRKIPSVVRFTTYGRGRWEPTWHELAQVKTIEGSATAPPAP